MDASASQDDLLETLLRWGVHDATPASVIGGAAQAVADGDARDWVIALACLSPETSSHDVEDVLKETPPDVGFTLVPRGNPEAVMAAALAMVKRCVAGRLAERELARWAHEFVGHDASDELEVLVCLDDEYDYVDYLDYKDYSTADVDQRVGDEAHRLAGLPRSPT